MDRPDTTLDVLVAGWFPAIDDPAAGRFVADQLAALTATGRVRPRMVAWESVALAGDGRLRAEQATATVRLLARGRRAQRSPFVARGAWGPEGVPVARLGAPAGPSATIRRDHQVVYRWDAMRAMLDDVGGPRPALVHAHVGYPEGAAAARAADHLSVPLVLTEHATYLDRLLGDPDTRPAYAAAARRAARVIAVSRTLADRILAELPDLADRLVVIPNTVDVEGFRLAAPGERVADELLWVGYRRPIKGIDTLLAAFRIVREARPAATLRLVGRSTSAAEEAGWHRLAAELGVAGAVAFDPPADRAGVAAAMARASIFVHASRYETFGVVAAEALAAGLPVVATDSGGVAEILAPDPEALGALVQPEDAAALAAAILRVLGRRETFDPEHLRAHVVDRYGARAVAERIADLYDEVVAEAAAGRGGPPAAGPVPAAPPAPPEAPRPTLATGPSWAELPPLVLVCFPRAALDRTLDALPTELRTTLAVVTTGGPVEGVRRATVTPPRTGPELGALLGWGTSSRPGPVGAVLRLAARGRRWLRRPRGAARDRILGSLSAAIQEAIEAEATTPLVVAVGGIDQLALDAVPTDRFIAAAGGVRWLGDRWWASRAGGESEPESGNPDQPARSS